MISLVAKEELTYAGRTFQAGDVFEATPIEAAALTYKRRASFAKKDATPTPEPEPAPVRRGRYRRRDLRAED
jgi:hypothetical protein